MRPAGLGLWTPCVEKRDCPRPSSRTRLGIWSTLVSWNFRGSDPRRDRSQERCTKSRVNRTGGDDDPTLVRSEEHTSELQSPDHLVCRLLLEKKNTRQTGRVSRPAPDR